MYSKLIKFWEMINYIIILIMLKFELILKKSLEDIDKLKLNWKIKY